MVPFSAFLPILWLVGLAFCYGTIIGSFLNVYIYRFHTGKSLSGRSHCLSCGTQLQWFELFPLFSYLCLGARCRTCRCHITSRYFLVELCTGVLFVAALLISGTAFELIYLWIALAILVVITIYDINHYIIPDSLTVALLALVGGWYLLRFFLFDVPLVVLGTDVLAALAGAGFFFLLWFVSKGQWIGFGDVKLAIPLGLMIGTAGVFSMVVFSFWIGAVVSLFLVFLSKLARGKLRLHLRLQNLTIKSVVPFAPFMIAGCLLVLFTHLNVLALFTL